MADWTLIAEDLARQLFSGRKALNIFEATAAITAAFAQVEATTRAADDTETLAVIEHLVLRLESIERNIFMSELRRARATIARLRAAADREV